MPRDYSRAARPITLLNEVWKAIPGHPNYEASSLGRIRSVFIHVLKPKLNYVTLNDEPSYEVVVLSGKRYLVHRLIAAAFHGERPNGKIVHHRDHVKRNNVPENLEYVTPSQNTKMAYADGYIGKTYKLTAFARKKVAEMYEEGLLTSVIAKQFRISKPTVLRCALLAGITPDRNRRKPGGGGRRGLRGPQRNPRSASGLFRPRVPNHPAEGDGGASG